MSLVVRRPVGLEYLRCVTSLLQHARSSNPSGGIWEAADLQWWWRRDQHPDPSGQVFWFDGDEPVAAAVVQNWGDRFGCELLSAEHDLVPSARHRLAGRDGSDSAAPCNGCGGERPRGRFAAH